MGRRAGFEPATARLSDEVTAIFTTDRDGVGGERAMLFCPFGRRVTGEVTDIFTTAGRGTLQHSGDQMGTLGNGDIGFQ
jgi:hypothetical protein